MSIREILFRGKRVDNGEWVYGDLIHHDGYVAIWDKNVSYVGDFEVIPKTVGQYTGLTDKNGNKIFKGDILEQDVVQSGTPHREFVEWDYDLLGNRYDEWSAFFEIIGNIHDNPELLEVE